MSDLVLPRQYNDDGTPLPALAAGARVWGGPADLAVDVPVSLPYADADDAERVLRAAKRLFPRWHLYVKDEWVACPITHEYALVIFERFGW